MNALTPALRVLTLLGILLSTMAASAPAASLPAPYAGSVSVPARDDPIAAWQLPPGERYESDLQLQALVDQVSASLRATFSLPEQIFTAVGPPVDDRQAIPVRATADPFAVLDFQAQGPLEACLIILSPLAKDWYEIYVRNATSESELDLAAAPDFFFGIAAHLYQCHQYHVLADVAEYVAVPRWIADGTAGWAGMQYAYGSTRESITLLGWDAYLDNLGQDLFTRDYYDAVGFFAHLHQQVARTGTDEQQFWLALDYMIGLPWSAPEDNPAMLEMLNTAALELAEMVGAPDFLAYWAMGTVREPDWGEDDAWWLITPGVSDEVRPPAPEVFVLAPDAPVEIRVGPRAIVHAMIQVAPGASVLRMELTGHGGIHWHDGNRDDVFTGVQTFTYCVDPAGCTCPDDSTPLGLDDARQLPDETATLALTGGREAGLAWFALKSLADLCTNVTPVTHAPTEEQNADVTPVTDAPGTACSCATLLLGSWKLDNRELEGTRFLACSRGSGPLSIILNVGPSSIIGK